MLITELPMNKKEFIMENNQDDAIRMAHVREHLEAAAENAYKAAEAANRIMTESLDYSNVEKSRTKQQIVSGYLFEEWTWLTSLESNIEYEDEFMAPDHCDHIDPQNPTVWVAMLATPNKLFCMECALDAATEDVESGKELCDRCHQPNPSGEFYDFMMPIVNIQMMGAICKGCLDKV